jgi:hypothetical protein
MLERKSRADKVRRIVLDVIIAPHEVDLCLARIVFCAGA